MIDTVIPDKNGRLYINGLKNHVKPFHLMPDPDNAEMALTNVIGNTNSQPMTMSQEGPFQGMSLIAESDLFTLGADHGCLVELQDAGSLKPLMNRPCHMNCVFGTPNFPMVLPEHLFMDEFRALQITLQQATALANNIRPQIAGRRFYPGSANSKKMNKFIIKLKKRAIVSLPFFLTNEEDNIVLAAGATNSFFFPADPDAYFEVFKMTHFSYDTTLATPTGTFDFELRDAETERRLSNGLMSTQLNLGTALQPYVFAESWLIPPRMRIEMRVTNTTAAGANALLAYVVLIGRKIYV